MATPYHGTVCNMAEMTMCKVKGGNHSGKLQIHWRKGDWLGKSGINDVNLVLVPGKGVVQVRSVHRLPGTPIWPKLQEISGVPWDIKRGLKKTAVVPA